MYVLIIMSIVGNSVATAEFNGYDRCMAAAKQVESVTYRMGPKNLPPYTAICVERGR